jgi:hypothetical protein
VKNDAEMSDTLNRNLYREKTIETQVLKNMVSYVYEQYEFIMKQDIGAILEGKIEFQLPGNFQK